MYGRLPGRCAADGRHAGAGSALEAVVGGEFRLRGIVDLIERRRARPAELRVTDYKTGGNYTRWRMVVGGGETLQPVLYPLAVESILDARVVEGRRAGDAAQLVAANARLLDALDWRPAHADIDTIVGDALEWERKLAAG